VQLISVAMRSGCILLVADLREPTRSLASAASLEQADNDLKSMLPSYLESGLIEAIKKWLAETGLASELAGNAAVLLQV